MAEQDISSVGMWVCRGRCVCTCMCLIKILLATRSRAPGKKKDKARYLGLIWNGKHHRVGYQFPPHCGLRSPPSLWLFYSSLSLGPLFLTHSFFFLLTMWICTWLQHALAPLYIKPFFFFFFFLVLAPTSDGTVFPMFLSLNCRDRKYSAADQPAGCFGL